MTALPEQRLTFEGHLLQLYPDEALCFDVTGQFHVLVGVVQYSKPPSPLNQLWLRNFRGKDPITTIQLTLYHLLDTGRINADTTVVAIDEDTRKVFIPAQQTARYTRRFECVDFKGPRIQWQRPQRFGDYGRAVLLSLDNRLLGHLLFAILKVSQHTSRISGHHHIEKLDRMELDREETPTEARQRVREATVPRRATRPSDMDYMEEDKTAAEAEKAEFGTQERKGVAIATIQIKPEFQVEFVAQLVQAFYHLPPNRLEHVTSKDIVGFAEHDFEVGKLLNHGKGLPQAQPADHFWVLWRINNGQEMYVIPVSVFGKGRIPSLSRFMEWAARPDDVITLRRDLQQFRRRAGDFSPTDDRITRVVDSRM